MTEIIAEVGSNWRRDTEQRSLNCVLEHIRIAKEVGATIVKFQLFRADDLYNKERAPKQWEQVKQYELPYDWLYEINTTAHKCGLKWWISVFDEESADTLGHFMGMDGMKIASGDITNSYLIATTSRWCSEMDIPFAISTGASNLAEVNRALLRDCYPTEPRNLFVFQCVSQYPASPMDYNLSVSKRLRTDNECQLGLSDHTVGVSPWLISMAVGMGYTAYEKHFSIDDTDSPDRCVSLLPYEFEKYVSAIQYAQAIYGDGVKAPKPSEIQERVWARRGKDGLRPANDEVTNG